MLNYRITTVDNPWNPYTNFNEWLSYDTRNGYRTSERLAALSVVSDRSSPDQNAFEVETAIDTMCELFPLLYKKVPRPA